MDRPKQGFGVPLIDWFKADLKPYLLDYLSEEKLNQVGLFNTPFVIQMRDNYLSGKEVSVNKLWLMLVFMLWWEVSIST